MIEFDGYISGIAEKHMWRKEKQFGIMLTFIALTLVLPFIILVYHVLKTKFRFDIWELPVLYCSMYVFIPLVASIPKSKKTKKALNTCKVFTDDEYIVAISGKGEEEYKLISDTRQVNDYGEFYELVFPLGKGITHSFICQKNLITKGTLEEFEALFEGKIVRKSKQG